MDDKLRWCFKQKRGLKLIEPNDNLANEYLKSAEETLLVLKNVEGKSNMWVATMKYYCEYFAAYALLMKFGVKSEIHDCTIEFLKFLEKEGIVRNISDILIRDKELRIENQYYLRNKKVEVDFNEIRDFVLYIRDKILMVNEGEVVRIRDKLRSLS